MLLALLGGYTYAMRSEWEEQTYTSAIVLSIIVIIDALITVFAIINVFQTLPQRTSRRVMGTLTAIVSPIFTSLFLLNAKPID